MYDHAKLQFKTFEFAGSNTVLSFGIVSILVAIFIAVIFSLLNKIAGCDDGDGSGSGNGDGDGNKGKCDTGVRVQYVQYVPMQSQVPVQYYAPQQVQYYAPPPMMQPQPPPIMQPVMQPQPVLPQPQPQ